MENAPEDGYEARSIHHSVFTHAGTFEELQEMVHDAVSCHFTTEYRPHLMRLHKVKEDLVVI